MSFLIYNTEVYFAALSCIFVVLLNKMDNLFIDIDFENGMVFLVETLKKCIENRIYGFINEKGDKCSVKFVFLGLKDSSYFLKRKSDDVECLVSKKVRKLNV